MVKGGYEATLVIMGGCFSVGRAVRAAVCKQYVADYLRAEEGKALILFTEDQEFKQIRVEEIENIEGGVILKFVSKNVEEGGRRISGNIGGGGDAASKGDICARVERNSTGECDRRLNDVEQPIYRNSIFGHDLVGEYGRHKSRREGSGPTEGKGHKYGGKVVGVSSDLTKYNGYDDDSEGNEVGAAEAEGIQGDVVAGPTVKGGEAVAHVTFSDKISCLWEDGEAVFPLAIYENMRKSGDTDTENINFENTEEEMGKIVQQMESIEMDLKERLVVMKADV